MGFERQYDIFKWTRGATTRKRGVQRRGWRRVEWNKDSTNLAEGALMGFEHHPKPGHGAWNEMEERQSRQRSSDEDGRSARPSRRALKCWSHELRMIYWTAGWGLGSTSWGMRSAGGDWGASNPVEKHRKGRGKGAYTVPNETRGGESRLRSAGGDSGEPRPVEECWKGGIEHDIKFEEGPSIRWGLRSAYSSGEDCRKSSIRMWNQIKES